MYLHEYLFAWMFCILTDLFPFYPSNCSRAQCWVNKHQKIYLFQRLVEAGNIQDKSFTITQKDGKRIYNILIYGSISKAPSWPTRIYPFLNYYHIHSLQKLLTDFSKNSFIFMRYSSRFARSFSKSEFEGVPPEFPPSENRTFSSCGTEQHFWKFFSIAQCEWSPNLDSKFCNTSVVPTLPVNSCDSLCGTNLLFPDFAFLFDTNKSCLKNGSESKESFGAPKWFSFFTNCFIELVGGSGRQIFSQWFKETCNDMNSKYYYTLYRKRLLIAPYNFLSGMMKSMQ